MERTGWALMFATVMVALYGLYRDTRDLERQLVEQQVVLQKLNTHLAEKTFATEEIARLLHERVRRLEER